MSTDRLSQNWIDVSIGAGAVGFFAYGLPQFPFVTGRLHDLLFMGFGPLLCLWAVGSYVFFRRHADAVSNQIAHLFLFLAGVSFTFMSTMQSSIFISLRRYYRAAAEGAEQEIWHKIFRGVSPSQLGLDFAFDIFVSVGVVLLAVQVMRHPRFWTWFGLPGILIGATGLTFNFMTFPENSGEAGLVDPGPYFAIWMALVFVQMCRCRAWHGAPQTV